MLEQCRPATEAGTVRPQVILNFLWSQFDNFLIGWRMIDLRPIAFTACNRRPTRLVRRVLLSVLKVRSVGTNQVTIKMSGFVHTCWYASRTPSHAGYLMLEFEAHPTSSAAGLCARIFL